jgi:hypothetical protein
MKGLVFAIVVTALLLLATAPAALADGWPSCCR